MNLIRRIQQGIAVWGHSRLPPRVVQVNSMIAYGTGTSNLELLKSLGYQAIVDLRAEASQDPNRTRVLGLDFIRIPIPDRAGPSPSQITFFLNLLESYQAESKKTYVHCSAGKGRSPTMILAYLVSKRKTTDDALYWLKQLDPHANPTPEQIQTIRAFERASAKKAI